MMSPPPSVSAIRENFQAALEPHTVTTQVPELDRNVGFVTTTLSGQMRWRTVRVRIDQESKLAGILFFLPESKTAKDELLPSLDYLNERTGALVDLYCAGYGCDWPTGYRADQKVQLTIDGHDWSFSPKAFNDLRRELSELTSWKYSGETDLLLFTARRDASSDGYFSPKPALACNLEQMARDGAFTSVRAFFERITNLTERYEGSDPVSYLSDSFGVRLGGHYLWEAILSVLPKTLRDFYQAGKHFAVRDISQ